MATIVGHDDLGSCLEGRLAIVAQPVGLVGTWASAVVVLGILRKQVVIGKVVRCTHYSAGALVGRTAVIVVEVPGRTAAEVAAVADHTLGSRTTAASAITTVVLTVSTAVVVAVAASASTTVVAVGTVAVGIGAVIEDTAAGFAAGFKEDPVVCNLSGFPDVRGLAVVVDHRLDSDVAANVILLAAVLNLLSFAILIIINCLSSSVSYYRSWCNTCRINLF